MIKGNEMTNLKAAFEHVQTSLTTHTEGKLSYKHKLIEAAIKEYRRIAYMEGNEKLMKSYDWQYGISYIARMSKQYHRILDGESNLSEINSVKEAILRLYNVCLAMQKLGYT